MKVLMYGAPICINCVREKEVLVNHKEIELEYRNITESTTLLKEFLAYRDNESMFAPIKEGGKIGIPFFILEDGRKTFDITEFVTLTEEDNWIMNGEQVNACSIDGKGNC